MQGMASLERIENQIFRTEMVRLDGKLFLNCHVEDCLLSFGGGLCEWKDTAFSNCRVVLDGPANYTSQVLQGLGFTIVARLTSDADSWADGGPDTDSPKT